MPPTPCNLGTSSEVDAARWDSRLTISHFRLIPPSRRAVQARGPTAEAWVRFAGSVANPARICDTNNIPSCIAYPTRKKGAVRLACRNDAFPLLPHETLLDLIAALGFDAYELIFLGERPPLPLSRVRDDLERTADAVAEQVAARNLTWSDVFVIPANDFTAMAANHPDPDERAAGRLVFSEMLEFVARIGAPGLTMLPGIDWPGESHDQSLARSAAELSERATEARDRGLRFSIEPHMGSLCHTPEDVLRLCEMAPGLELTLDYGHYTAAGIADEQLEPLLPHTRHFHTRPAAPGRLQTPLKENTIDFERAIDLLAKYGYDGFILVEYLWAELDARLDNVDILSETIMLRDRLRAKLDGLPWSYPNFGEFDTETQPPRTSDSPARLS